MKFKEVRNEISFIWYFMLWQGYFYKYVPDRLFMFTVMPVEKEEFSSFRINRKGKYIGVKDIPKDAKTLDEAKDIDMVYTYLIYELEV